MRSLIYILAKTIWTPYTVYGIASEMNITRRKVENMISALTENGYIFTISPYYTDTTTETSRDDKIYFTDLAMLSGILDESYSIVYKKWSIENFAILELRKKISPDTQIYFYKKKSKSDISIVLHNTKTDILTPIEILLWKTKSLPKSIKTFTGKYKKNIDRCMILTDMRSEKTDYEGISTLIFPYFAI
jgi:predicted AAA+ superfamily ATPase